MSVVQRNFFAVFNCGFVEFFKGLAVEMFALPFGVAKWLAYQRGDKDLGHNYPVLFNKAVHHIVHK